MTRVAVVGAGWSGLFTAASLRARGAEVILIDASPRPGGVAIPWEIDGFRLEPAASTVLLPHRALTPLLGGMPLVPVPAARRRFLYAGGRLTEVKPGPGLLLAPFLSWRARVSALIEPFRGRSAPEEESIAGFTRRRFGDEAGRLMAGVLAAGVFAGDPEELSVEAAFPRLRALERETGSVVVGALRAMRTRATRPVTHVPVGGMAVLAERFVSDLDVDYRGGERVEAVAPTVGGWRIEGDVLLEVERVVLATGPLPAAALVPDHGLAALLGQAAAAPVAVVFLGGSDGVLPDAFGYLVDPDAGMVSLGAMFESALDPDRAPPGNWLVKIVCGGALSPETVDWPDESLVTRVGEELAAVLGRRVHPSFGHVVRLRPGIPQYGLDHRRWLAEIEERMAALPGLHLTGWGYDGVGLADRAASAASLAARLTAS